LGLLGVGSSSPSRGAEQAARSEPKSQPAKR
jgi:hypothetical protein